MTIINRKEAVLGGKVWRLVHDGVRVCAVLHTCGQTETRHTIEEYETPEALCARVAELELELGRHQLPEVAEPEPEPDPEGDLDE